MKRTHLGLAASAVLAVAALAMPEGLGQQLRTSLRPGSGGVAKRDRPTGFWGDPHLHVPRVLTPEQRAKHAAKLMRRYKRWDEGLLLNPCVSAAQYWALTASN